MVQSSVLLSHNMRVNFPFSNISTVGSVVTASLASNALFLSASVSSSTFALSPRGPIGPSGSTVNVDGTQGPPGGFGPSGSAGLDALLLSSSRALCAGECYEVINGTLGSILVAWTDLNGDAQSDNLDASTTVYICSRTTPATTGTVNTCGSPCDKLIITIAQAQDIPCAC